MSAQAKFVIKNVIRVVTLLFAVSVITFALATMAPIDPVEAYAGSENHLPQEQLDLIAEKWGWDQPPVQRYFNWIGGILRGDFGYSIANGNSIGAIIAARLPATIELALVAMLLSAILGITIGIFSAIYQNSIIDYVGRFFAVLGQAIPQFFFGICLICAVSGGNLIKGLIAAVVGLMIKCVGMDPVTSVSRYVFDYTPLLSGFTFIAVIF